MLSRIADSLYWLNRYMERSEGILRILHTHYILSFDTGTPPETAWQPVLQLFSHADAATLQELSRSHASALHHLVADAGNINSVKSLVGKARENARGIQDNITKEVWEQVNQLYHWMQEPAFEERLRSPECLPLIDEALSRTILFVGIADTTMPRGLGWSFMNLGRFTERCLLTVQLAAVQFAAIDFDLNQERDILHWRHLLFNLSGYEHHLKTYRSSQTNYNVVDQIILDKNFPRSVKYTLNRMEKYLKDVVQGDAVRSQEAEQMYLAFSRFNSTVQFADMHYIRQHGLQPFLEGVRQDIFQFSTRLGQLFFSYS
ncbi:MAG TPA: alpha-E domain-containing protein [Lacibacter sp.]|nr:alpha-E domain-containing protein [Lacibacter sp.]HMO87750.1 alpha-E domain-containing protein [Lacibacter sp.]HMP85678.1 alpha-E domain-containing protein [Lacibacter sp.]